MRPIFITTLMLLLLAATGHSLGSVLAAESAADTLTWAGAALAAGGFLGFFVYLFAVNPARTSRRLPGVLVLTATGGMLAVLGWLSGGPTLAALYALGPGLGGSLLYVFWYSHLPRGEVSRLAAGQRLPDFDLADADGNAVASADFLGRPALWLFYRGNWCPLCMAQVKEIAARYRELAERGVQVLLVSPQPAGHSRQLAARFEVPMRFLVDAGNRAARALGIAAADGIPRGMELLGYDSETVLPTVLLADAQGRILWSDQTDNYRVRPEPETFIRVLDEHTIPTHPSP